MSFDPGTNVVDVHVSNLRKKLEESGRARLIQTVRGVGFALRREES
jgi:DNA-binding response OmpR family regulator